MDEHILRLGGLASAGDDDLINTERTARIVGVRLSPTGPVRYFDPGDTDPAVGDRVVVDDDDGPQEGVVAIAPDQVLYSELRGQPAPVLRKLDSSENA